LERQHRRNHVKSFLSEDSEVSLKDGLIGGEARLKFLLPGRSS
jgi:hypothetical protein